MHPVPGGRGPRGRRPGDANPGNSGSDRGPFGDGAGRSGRIAPDSRAPANGAAGTGGARHALRGRPRFSRRASRSRRGISGGIRRPLGAAAVVLADTAEQPDLHELPRRPEGTADRYGLVRRFRVRSPQPVGQERLALGHDGRRQGLDPPVRLRHRAPSAGIRGAGRGRGLRATRPGGRGRPAVFRLPACRWSTAWAAGRRSWRTTT
jgi:hypothetical protein